MLQDQISKLLQDLGFCEKSAALYVCLLSDGPLPLTDLVHKFGFTEEQTSSLLGGMIANRLIFEDGGSYWVLNPKKAFKAFANNITWSVTSTISDGLDDVPEDHLIYVKRIHEICQRLQKTASELYTYRSPIAVGRIKVARDPDQLAALLVETIDSAQEEILSVSTSPRQHQLSVIWESLLGRIKDGVRYVRVVDIMEIVDHGFKIVERDIEEVGVELYVIERERIDRKFYIIDDKFVVMFTPDKYNAYDFTLTGQIISNRLITGNYRKAFNVLLKDAIPVSFLLKLMAEEKDNLLLQARSRVDPIEVRWLECLVDFGIYCKFPEFDPHQLTVAMERAVRENIVEIRKSGDIVIPLPKYSWSMAEIRSRWLAQQAIDHLQT